MMIRIPAWFIVILLPMAAAGATLLVLTVARANWPATAAMADGEATYREVLSLIESEYVDSVEREALVDGAVNGMLQVLDDYSRGYSRREWAAFESTRRGSRDGIGIVFGSLRGAPTVLRVVPGGPAERGGVQAGDELVKIDDRAVTSGMDNEALEALLSGPPGSSLRLEVRRRLTAEVETLTVRRGEYTNETVVSRRIDGSPAIGYVRLAGFDDRSVDEFVGVVEGFRDLDGFVLDLRNNPGGDLSVAVGIVSTILSIESVLTAGYRASSQVYPPTRTAVDLTSAIVVLVDEETASAAEVVAGALQDARRAPLVGETTFGKGVVQNIYELETRPGGVKLTTAHWYTPSGRSIQRAADQSGSGLRRGGVRPDHVVVVGDQTAREIQTGWERAEMPPFIAEALASDPEQQRSRGPDDDPQLSAALAILRGQRPAPRLVRP